MLYNSPLFGREKNDREIGNISQMYRMAKLKPLLPSLREKKRYLAYEIISKESLDLFAEINEIEETILDASLEYMGYLGMSQAGIIVLKDRFDAKRQKGLIRVANKSVDNLKASLAFVGNIGNHEVIVRTLGISGIMKKAYDNYISG
jgi:ribonuclease P/MRP protein subunit POP5